MFKKYETPLSAIFIFFTKLEDMKLDKVSEPTLSFKMFSKLCLEFSLIPFLASTEELLIIFKSLTKPKKKEVTKKESIINYTQFQEAIIKFTEYGIEALKSDTLKPKHSKEFPYMLIIDEVNEGFIEKVFKIMKILPTDNKITLNGRLEKLRNSSIKERKAVITQENEKKEATQEQENPEGEEAQDANEEEAQE